MNSLIHVLCGELGILSKAVEQCGPNKVVLLDDSFGTQMIYMQLRTCLERIQGDPNGRLEINVEDCEVHEASTVRITCRDNGGRVETDAVLGDLSNDSGHGNPETDWLGTQLVAVRSLARLHGGEAEFRAWHDKDETAGLRIQIFLPNRISDEQPAG